MEFAIIDNDPRMDGWLPARSISALNALPPAGWRLNPFKRPHLKNQLIRRGSRSSSGATHLEQTRVLHRTEAQKKEFAQLISEFHKHAQRWQKDVMALSSISDMVLHPSYLRIIGMGMPAVPLILDELQKKQAHWFQALEAITGQNPLEETDRGRIGRMTQRWIDWAKAQHIVS